MWLESQNDQETIDKIFQDFIARKATCIIHNSL